MRIDDDWTREDLAAALRAEIERDGVPVHISDDELLWAYAEPMVRARRRALEALAALAGPATRATAAMLSLAETIERGEAFDRAREGIATLPEAPEPFRPMAREAA